MIDIAKHSSLLNKKIIVTCTDDDILTGEFVDWTSEQDNEPDPESITVKADNGAFIELYVNEIKSIEAA